MYNAFSYEATYGILCVSGMEEGIHISLAAERLFSLWGVPITNTIVTSAFIATLLISAAFIFGRRLRLIPGRVQTGVEMAFEYVFGYVEQALGSRALAVRYFPLVATIFLFILVANWLHFFPFVGHSIGFENSVTQGLAPLLRAPNTDLNTSLALAIIVFLVVEISGILALGVLKYGSKFVNFKTGAIGFIVGLLEIVGNLARLVSLSFRLFGAIFAGEVLLLVMGVFVPYFVPVPLMAFELFIGLLQAAIFAILTLAYIKLALEEPHGSHEHKPQTHAGALGRSVATGEAH